MAVATFVENDFGTASTWAVIYDTWWFELIMLGLALSFFANIFKYNLFRKEKWAIFLFHVAFIITLLGAAITRYTSYTGVMRIRENATSNTIISSSNYLNLHINDDNTSQHFEKPLVFSPIKDNQFEIASTINNKNVKLKFQQFIADATPIVVPDSINGKPTLQVTVSHADQKQTLIVKQGDKKNIDNHHLLHFIKSEEIDSSSIQITKQNHDLFLKAPMELDFFVMASQVAGKIPKDSIHILKMRTLYRMGDLSFVFSTYEPKGKIAFATTAENPKDNESTKEDIILTELSVDNETLELPIIYREGFLPITHPATVNGIDFKVSYGSKAITTPFSLKLIDFQLERYPGSSSPSSYASEIQVLDKDESYAYRIFMNNVLDHKGYRFFQASYDTDEKGTVLSVNRDFWGTQITYLGYLLMGIGMFFTLFSKNSRFSQINKKLKKLNNKTVITAAFLTISCFSIHAQNTNPLLKPVNETHAEYFGRILVQDLDGRIKPINTLASEFVRKLTRKNYLTYEYDSVTHKLNPNQVFLSIHIAPSLWQDIPIIKIDKKKGGDLLKDINTKHHGLVSFKQLLSAKGDYILAKEVEDANSKKPAERNEFDKEVLKIDERFNILYNIFIGNYIKIFPKAKDPSNTWYSYSHHFRDFPNEDQQFVSSILQNYFKDVITTNWKEANEKITYIKTYQNVLAEEIVPSTSKIEAEIWYNKLNLNFWLFQILFTIGFGLLAIALARIFTKNRFITFLWNVFVIITLVSLIIFSANLILRWYVAGHAPWSNGYEMLVFVAWCLLLSGMLLFRKSDFTLPLATLFSGALLFVSYLDWLNPEITNLMPVLKSYWLKVHVATIVSSYAPLALSAILGLMGLILIIIKTPKNKASIDIKIKEISYINELSMCIGLFVLSIGTFLGGVWANESWGRYWAWDPKETWALISIIVYAIVLHLRFIPKLNNSYVLNTASLFAFWSIIMTSFGVNYYLTGLHSYATGDPIPIPKFIYFILATQILVSILAFFKNKQKTLTKAK